MKSCSYDTAVIGAGPAGSRAATLIASEGFSVLLLEKRERIGFPVRCAEAVGPREDVERYVSLDDTIVSSPVNGFLVASPDGEIFMREMRGIGFTVNREAFDRALAARAAAAGAEIRTSHQAVGLVMDGGRVRGLRIKDLASGTEYTIDCRIVIGADGIESLSPRWAGLKQAFRAEEMFSCAQELIDDYRKEKANG